MPINCLKCSKKFKSQYLLNKHLNQKVSCDSTIKFICNKCKKEFKSDYHLQRHNSRKKDCSNDMVQINNDSIIQLEIEKEKTKIEKEKTKREIERTKQEEEKTKLEKEKTKQEEEKTKRELEKMKLKIELLKVESENKKKENIIVEEKNNEKPTTVINNNYTQNNNTHNTTIIEATNYINNTFDAKIVLESKGFAHKEVNHLNMSLQDPKFIKDMYEKSSSLFDFLVNIIQYSYNNDNFPENRYFASDQEKDLVFELDRIAKKYKKTSFKNIRKHIQEITDRSFQHVKKIISQDSLDPKDSDILSYEINYIRNRGPLIKPAMIGLDLNNRMEIDSPEKSSQSKVYKKKIKRENNKYGGAFSSTSDEEE